MRFMKVVDLNSLQQFINDLIKRGRKVELVDYDFGDEGKAAVFYRKIKNPNRSGATKGNRSKVDMGFWWD